MLVFHEEYLSRLSCIDAAQAVGYTSDFYIVMTVIKPNMFQFVLFAAVLHFVFFKGCNGECIGGTYDATTTPKFVTNLNYKNNEDCTINIRPTALHTSGFYLEIKWLIFDVEGEMDACEHDYVEVELTRSSVAIGKFCSDNVELAKPFDMYSADGYAQVKFKSDSSVTRAGYKFSYQLKSRSLLNPSSSLDNICGKDIPVKTTKSGLLDFNGWTNSNQEKPSTFCNQIIDTVIDTGASSETKLVFMPVVLPEVLSTECNASSSYVEILQSSQLYSQNSDILSYSTSISGHICGKHGPMAYTATERYIYIYFNKARDSVQTTGKFMIGYLSYDDGNNDIISLANDISQRIQTFSSFVTLRRRSPLFPTLSRRRVSIWGRRRIIIPPVILRRRTIIPPVILRRRTIIPPVILRRRTIIPPVILRRRTIISRRRSTKPPMIPTRPAHVPLVISRRRKVIPVISRRRKVIPVISRRRKVIPVISRRITVISRKRATVPPTKHKQAVSRRRAPVPPARRRNQSASRRRAISRPMKDRRGRNRGVSTYSSYKIVIPIIGDFANTVIAVIFVLVTKLIL